MGKVLEKLLLVRLRIYIIPKIRPEQYGFRSEHSTAIQLINVIDSVTDTLNIRHKTAATWSFRKSSIKSGTKVLYLNY